MLLILCYKCCDLNILISQLLITTYLLGDQGVLKQAKEYHERALDIRLQRLGRQQPDAATSYNNLATKLRHVGDLKQEKEYHERALQLPAYLFYQIERLQKRVLRILFPEDSYSKVLEDAGLKTLFHRREELCSSLFKQIVESDRHKLAGPLPALNDSERYNFRTGRMFSIPNVKTKRFRNTFMMHFAIRQQS